MTSRSVSQVSADTIRRKKLMKRGVSLSIMVVGASGLGRTTFVNSLCGRNVLSHADIPDPSLAHLEPKVDIRPITVELDEEDGSRTILTIVDTPGFGDNIDNEESFKDILGYLENQYDTILSEETRIRRNPRFKDTRVHALIYFITPTGHGLRELDIELMKRLSPRVNVIPVIGRADTFTEDELSEAKRLIMEDIEHYKIPIYNFPYDIEEDDEFTVAENAALRNMLPFAIVGSEELIEVNGKRVRARQYPWGVVDIEESPVSDFLALRSALLVSHLSDLKEITHDYLYENYRTEKLSKSVSGGTAEGSLDPDDMVNNSYLLKEEQLRRDGEKLREIELKVQKEINDKRAELLARESELKQIEARLGRSSATPNPELDGVSNGFGPQASSRAGSANPEGEVALTTTTTVIKEEVVEGV